MADKQKNEIGSISAGAVTFGPNSPARGTVAPAAARASAAGSDRGHSRTLLVVVADVERAAVMDRVRAATDTPFRRRYAGHHTVYELGRIARTDVMLAQVGPGTVTPDAAGLAALSLIDKVRPDQLVLSGICYGLRDDDPRRPQRLGDVIVANQLRLIAHRKVAQVPGSVDPTVISRGGQPHPSDRLLDRLRSAALDWSGPASVHFGPVLSESVLVDSLAYREELRRAEPEAIGGEMEGAGVYAAAARGKVDWALVKGICDWGHGKGDDHQRAAADNAAALLVHAMEIGGLDPDPAG